MSHVQTTEGRRRAASKKDDDLRRALQRQKSCEAAAQRPTAYTGAGFGGRLRWGEERMEGSVEGRRRGGGEGRLTGRGNRRRCVPGCRSLIWSGPSEEERAA